MQVVNQSVNKGMDLIVFPCHGLKGRGIQYIYTYKTSYIRRGLYSVPGINPLSTRLPVQLPYRNFGGYGNRASKLGQTDFPIFYNICWKKSGCQYDTARAVVSVPAVRYLWWIGGLRKIAQYRWSQIKNVFYWSLNKRDQYSLFVISFGISVPRCQVWDRVPRIYGVIKGRVYWVGGMSIW